MGLSAPYYVQPILHILHSIQNIKFFENISEQILPFSTSPVSANGNYLNLLCLRARNQKNQYRAELPSI